MINRTRKICSDNNKLKKQLNKIRSCKSWKNFPNYIVKRISQREIEKPLQRERNNDEKEDTKLYLKLPYLGSDGENLVKTCVKKLHRFLKPEFKIDVKYKTNNISMFCPKKDQTNWKQKSNVIYEITCPSCKQKYIGKTDRCLLIRIKEHGMREDQPMFQHFMKCEQFKDEFYMFNLPSIFGYDEAIDMKELFGNSIIQNCKVIDMNRN